MATFCGRPLWMAPSVIGGSDKGSRQLWRHVFQKSQHSMFRDRGGTRMFRPLSKKLKLFFIFFIFGAKFLTKVLAKYLANIGRSCSPTSLLI